MSVVSPQYLSELDFHTMYGFQIIAERVAHILSRNQLRSLDGIVSKAQTRWSIGEKVRRERRWTSAGATPARELVRSIR